MHGNPESNTFGLTGAITPSDEGVVYIKKTDPSRNIGWEPVPTSIPETP